MADAYRRSEALAKRADQLGYRRFWLAEHHNMPSIGSAATSVLIGHIAGVTEKIRVGSGGIMLPNHAPLVIAEQFGTLEALYPGRIDLGVGRAPGTDTVTAHALRRDLAAERDLGELVTELRSYLGDPAPGQSILASPGQGSHVPIWILGSSLYGASLAASMGLPYAFASHFAPQALASAAEVYRHNYRPSEAHPRPYFILTLQTMLADTEDEALYLFSTTVNRFKGIVSGKRSALQPPTETIELTPMQQAKVASMAAEALVGSKESVAVRLAEVVARTGADEVMAVCDAYDNALRIRNFEYLAEVAEDVTPNQ